MGGLAALTGLPGLPGLPALPRLPRLPALPGCGLARVRERSPAVLELACGGREVAIGRDPVDRVGQGLGETIEGGLGSSGVALGQALGGITEGLAGCATRLACRSFELRELARQLLLLGVGLPRQLGGELLQVLGRLLRVAVAVRLGVRGRRPREASAQRRQRSRALLVGRIEL